MNQTNFCMHTGAQNGDTPLHDAARLGDAGTVENICKWFNDRPSWGTGEIDRGNLVGNTPLHLACLNGFEGCEYAATCLLDEDAFPISEASVDVINKVR